MNGALEALTIILINVVAFNQVNTVYNLCPWCSDMFRQPKFAGGQDKVANIFVVGKVF